MRPPTSPLAGLKLRLTLMMGLLLATSLSLTYFLNRKAEQQLVSAVEDILAKVQEEVNDHLEENLERQRAEVAGLQRATILADPLGMLRRHRRSQRAIPDELEQMLADLGQSIPKIQFHYVLQDPRHQREQIKIVRFQTMPARRIQNSLLPVLQPTAGTDDPDRVRVIQVPLANLQILARDLRFRNALIVVGVFLFGMILSWVLATRFTAPIREMKVAFGRVASGDLRDTPLPKQKDEIGEMGESFQVMIRKMREKRDLEKRLVDQERFTTLGHLAAGVAHDIRNPLNAIGLTVDHMQDEFCPADVEKKESFLRFTAAVRGEIARLNHLVNNFLTLAKPPSLDVRPGNLNEIVGSLLDLVRKEAESRGVTVTTELQADMPDISLDTERIRGAVMNLLLNALQALDGKGNIRIETTVIGREARLLVQDDGPGIKTEDVEKVFLPYWTTREDGTGLGLAVSRATVEGHGGRIDIASRVGQGTTVRVVLPLQGPVPKPQE